MAPSASLFNMNIRMSWSMARQSLVYAHRLPSSSKDARPLVSHIAQSYLLGRFEECRRDDFCLC